MIKWTEVTWYSKALAMILFIFLPFFGFYFGVQYGKTVGLENQSTEFVPTEIQEIQQGIITTIKKPTTTIAIASDQQEISWSDTLQLIRECRMSSLSISPCKYGVSLYVQSGQ